MRSLGDCFQISYIMNDRIQLNECMTEFMALTEEEFGYLSRLGRISCTKQLRTMMGQRMGVLLSSEVNRSLTDIT